MKRIDHPVRFQIQRPIADSAGKREGLEVVGAVIGVVPLALRAVLVNLLGDVQMCFGVPLNFMCSSRWAMPVSP